MAHKGISHCTANIKQALEKMLGPGVGPKIQSIKKRHYVIVDPRWVPKPISIYDSSHNMKFLMAHKGISNCTAGIEQALEKMLGPRVGPKIQSIKKGIM